MGTLKYFQRVFLIMKMIADFLHLHTASSSICVWPYL